MVVVDTQAEAIGVEMAGLKAIRRYSKWAGAIGTKCGLHGKTNVLIDAILSRPSTRRLRFPFGRRFEVGLGREPKDLSRWRELTEERQDALTRPFRVSVLASIAFDSAKRISQKTAYNGNPRQGWAPDGTVLA